MSTIYVNNILPTTGDTTTVSGSFKVTGSMQVTGNVYMAGNLTVEGTTTTVNSTAVNITSSLTFEGPADAHETTLHAGGDGTGAAPGADTTIYLPAMSAGSYYLPVLAVASTTAVSSTPAELNLLDGSSAGTVVNSKGVIYSSAGAVYTSIIDGAATVTLSGSTDVRVENDLRLDSDSSVLSMGIGNDATLTHDGTTGLTIAATPVSVNSTGNLTLDSTTDIVLSGSSEVRVENDLRLDSDSAVFSMGAGDDFTITHDGTTGVTIKGDPIVLQKAATTAGAHQEIMRLEIKDEGVDMNIGNGPGIDFYVGETGGSNYGGTVAVIREVASDADSDAAMVFHTATDDQVPSTDRERMRITSAGKVGIGLTSPSTALTVSGSITLAEQAAADSDTAALGQLWVKNTTPNQLYYTTDAGDDIQITSGTGMAFVGDITGVTAGTGLSGGGTSGTVSLAVGAAQTTITSILATDVKIGEDDETKIDFETVDEIHFYAANVEQVYVADNIFGPQSDSDVDLGTTGVRWKDAFVDSVTVTANVSVGDDLLLASDSAILSLGIGADATLTHDGTTGLTIAANPISIDATGQLHLSTTLGDIRLQDGGVDQIGFDLDGTSGVVVMKTMVDTDDLVFQQYDGNEVIRVADDRRLYFYDKGGEYIAGDGSHLTLTAGGFVKAAGAFSGSSTAHVVGATTLGSTLQTTGSVKVGTAAGSGADAFLYTAGTAAHVGIQWDADGNTEGMLIGGADDHGVDFKFFGETSGKYIHWNMARDELVLAATTKLNFHDDSSGGGEHIFASANGHLEVNAGTTLDMTAPTVDVNASTAVTLDTPSVVIASATASKPRLELKNTTNDTNSAILRFVKDKGSAGAANDNVGIIEFYGDDASQDQVLFGRIRTRVAVHTNGQEGGKMQFAVASHDGELQPGLTIGDGDAEDEVDVTIGNGADSLTTIAGDLDIPNGGFALGSDASGDMYYNNSSGVLTRVAVGSDNHVLTLDGAVPGWEAASAGAVSAVANGANNRIVTFSSSDALNGEANLTFNGSALGLVGTFSGSSTAHIVGATTLGSSLQTTGSVKVGTAAGSGADAFLYTAGTSAHVGIQWDADGNTEGMLIGGADDHGVDFKFFGETSGKYIHWNMARDELVLAATTKLNFHDDSSGGGEHIFASANGHLEINAGTTLDMTAPTVDINASTAVTIDGPSVVISSATSEKPNIEIKNTNADANGSSLQFTKNGSSVADNDVIGNIAFVSEDDGDNVHMYAAVVATVADMTGGSEGGRLSFNVAENDGTVTSGLVLQDGDADGEIDVAIGSGPSSVTTIAGTVNLGTDADGVDRTVIFGHSTLKTIMGIDDSADTFIINTDAAFDGTVANNSLSIDANHKMIVGGQIRASGSIREHYAQYESTSADERSVPMHIVGESTLANLDSVHSFVAPFDGRFARAYIRTQNAQDANVTFRILKIAAGADIATWASSDEIEQVVVSQGGAHAVGIYNTSGSAHWVAGDAIAFTVDPVNNPGKVNVTLIWEYDTTGF